MNALLTERDFRFLGEMGRYDAFLHLYHSNRPEDAALLSALLSSKDPLVPLILLQYLEEMPEKKAVVPIIRLIQDENEVVSRAAMNAYRKNHYPGKARLLKQLILSPKPRACRFAVRVLSRAGFVDALPLILRELPDREGEVRQEMMEALRFLPDRRIAPVLLPLAESEDETTRFLAVQVLAELQMRERALPAQFFLKRATDESERVRRVAVEALQRLPTRGVAKLFLEQALKQEESELNRERALRALAAFPSREWVPPLVRLLSGDEPSSVKLAAEIALRSLPERTRRAGLLKLLHGKDPDLKRSAALVLSEHHGREKAVRKKLLALWRSATEDQALELTDMLRELGGDEPAALLLDSVKRSPLVAYAAAEALTRVLGTASGPRALAMLRDPETPQLAKQALLGYWAKRGPADSIRDELHDVLVPMLADEVVNIRYLALQSLVWYPLDGKLQGILGLLERETSPDIARAAHRQILKGLGRDPMPLVWALREHPRREAILGHVLRVLTSQSWDPALVFDLLHALAREPLDLRSDSPEAFFAVCVHLLERGATTLEKVWIFLDDGPLRRRFLLLLLSFMRSPQRRFPPLSIDFLAYHLAKALPEERTLYYSLLEADGRPASAEALVTALLTEAEPECLKAGRESFLRLVAAAGAAPA